MKRWLLIPVVLVVVALTWFALGSEQRAAVTSAIGLTPSPTPAVRKDKPICSQVIVPAGADCIPQHMANLPPDPGEAGKLTIEGIDADKDGVRDDVQRWIAENWGHSERAVKALTMVAKAKQDEVLLGDSLGKEGTRAKWPDIDRRAQCNLAMETPEMLRASAYEHVKVQVMNTPERYLRAAAFNQMAVGGYALGEDKTPVEACGFDPATLPN